MKNVVAALVSVVMTVAVLGAALAFPPALGNAEVPAGASVVAVD